MGRTQKEWDQTSLWGDSCIQPTIPTDGQERCFKLRSSVVGVSTLSVAVESWLSRQGSTVCNASTRCSRSL